MAKEYKVGEKYYLPVTVKSICPGYKYPIDLEFIDSNWGDTEDSISIADEPDLLLIAEDIAMVINTERDDALEELKSRNAELETLLKEVMATRDEAIKQNNELIAENKRLAEENLRLRNKAIERTTNADNLMKENERLKGDCNEWKDAVDKRIIDIQTLTAERDNLKADNANLKAWYEEANKTASEAAEANDELKKKIAELRDEVANLKAERDNLKSQVGKYTADIQDMAAEIHYLKEERDLKAKLAQEWHDNAHSTAKGLDELKSRYDELDSVNKEQAEKSRKLDKALTDLKKRNDDLQAENTNLTFLLEDAPEKETTKTLHVVLNDGTEIEFRRYTAYDYRTDIKMFVVKDGERFIAGFNRGDKSFNFAYWWTE